MAKNTVSKVTKFLGLNESADSAGTLALGEAVVADNWDITDDHSIRVRPGVRVLPAGQGKPSAIWSGYIRDQYYLIYAVQNEKNAYTTVHIAKWANSSPVSRWANNGPVDVCETRLYHRYGKSVVKIFTLFSTVYIAIGSDIWMVDHQWDGTPFITQEQPYIPIAITGSAPQGGGNILENLNILSDFARIQYSADGTSAAFVLPDNAKRVTNIMVDNVKHRPVEVGEYSPESKTFLFSDEHLPPKGVNNVEITFEVEGSDLLNARDKFGNMRCSIPYNGATDSRIFFYGDGSNIMYYTGVTEAGRGSALYIPAANEVAVDSSDSPVTSAVRHLSKLLIFKPDMTATITYEPITLEDGRVIAGFTMRTIHSEFGCTPIGQAQIVENKPRTISQRQLVEWVLPNVYSNDERNAKVISERVAETLRTADNLENAIALDNQNTETFFIFLNNAEGKVLVNRYNLGTWTAYTGAEFTNVVGAVSHNGMPIMLAENVADGTAELRYFDSSFRYDRENTTIPAVWQTGYMDFGKDYLRKYSNRLWITLQPQEGSLCEVTAATDRRDEYAVKEISAPLEDTSGILHPVIKKIKLKVKKFVSYRLIFRVEQPGATAHILGYSQELREGSEVK